MKSEAFKTYKPLLFLFLAILAIRLFSLGLYPLMDTTEARYAEMARLMTVNGDWVTPYIEPGVPFWGKPPLQTWVSAASFELFGINEFAARLPHFLAGMLVLLLVRLIALKRYDPNQSLAVTLVLASTAVFMMSIGAVMTDTLLMLSITLSLVSAWQVISLKDKKSGYLLYVGLGIGMLAKGPIAIVLVGVALFLWCLIGNQWRNLWQELPWFTGSLIALAISAPWFLLAELKTPGFLEYFFIGEHWLRFTVSGWQGDLYGEAHAEPRGTIWLYALMGGFPWSLVLIFLLVRSKVKGPGVEDQDRQQWRMFLWSWALAPLLFFSPSANILPAYVLPGAPALALLVVEYIKTPIRSQVLALSCLTPIIFCVSLALLSSGRVEPKADKNLLVTHEREANESPLVYWKKLPYSARFYSHGVAILTENSGELIRLLGDRGIVVTPRNTEMPDSFLDQYHLKKIGENQRRLMYQCTRKSSDNGIGQ